MASQSNVGFYDRFNLTETTRKWQYNSRSMSEQEKHSIHCNKNGDESRPQKMRSKALNSLEANL